MTSWACGLLMTAGVGTGTEYRRFSYSGGRQRTVDAERRLRLLPAVGDLKDLFSSFLISPENSL